MIVFGLLLSSIASLGSALAPFHSSIQHRSIPHGPPSYNSHQSDHSPSHGGFDFAAHPWIPASQITNSSRSPCPLLNTIANHGFLPRSGRSISIQTFNTALVASLNLSPSFANCLSTSNFHALGLLATNQTYTDATIDLETLNAYNKTEHDASLTRGDKFQSNTLTPKETPEITLYVSQSLLQELLNDSPTPYIDTKSLGLSRLRRERESLAAGSPPLSASTKQVCLNEAGLVVQFLGVGGDPHDGTGEWDQRRAWKGDVWEWFAYERFPRDWRRTRHVVTVEGDMLPLAARVGFWEEWWGSRGE